MCSVKRFTLLSLGFTFSFFLLNWFISNISDVLCLLSFSLRYNWQINCKIFKLYNEMIWYTSIVKGCPALSQLAHSHWLLLMWQLRNSRRWSELSLYSVNINHTQDWEFVWRICILNLPFLYPVPELAYICG